MLVLSGVLLIALPVIKVLRKSKTTENEDETQMFTMTTTYSISKTNNNNKNSWNHFFFIHKK